MLMRAHSSMWSSLGDDAKAAYEQQAAQQASEKRQRLSEDIAEVWVAQSRCRLGLTSQRLDEGGALRVSGCAFTWADMEAMATLYDSSGFSRAKVEQRMQERLTAPVAPSAAVLAALAGMDVALPPTDGGCPSWCAPICRHRERFQDCALVFDDGEVATTYLFLYANQSPFMASFLPLMPLDSAGASSCSHRRLPNDLAYDFEFKVGRQYTREKDILVDDQETEVFVLGSMVWTKRGTLASHSVKIPLALFLYDAPPPVATTSPKGDGHKAEDLKELRAKYPFMAKLMDDVSRKKAGGFHTEDAQGDSPAEAPEGAADFNDRELEDIFSALEARRKEW